MKYHLLSIGISQHQNIDNNLRFADKDASDFYHLFKQNVPDVGYHKLLINSEATLTNIRTALGKELQKAVGTDDVFFFLFSGHGATAEDDPGKSLSHFLIPFDVTDDIPNSSLSISDLKSLFDRITCKASFIFIDSCFSGAINGKSLPSPKLKGISIVKTFNNQVFGNGNVVFTASKPDETAIEDPEYEHGLFIYNVLEEFQKKRESDKFPVGEIFDPVTSRVIERAKRKYNHDQTPTIKMDAVGPIYLPVFRQRLKFNPQFLDIPQYSQLQAATLFVPEIEADDQKIQKQINDLMSITARSNNPQDRNQVYQFDRFCWKLTKNLKNEWEKIFIDTGSDVLKIPEAVTKIETAALQLIMLGSVVALCGSKHQMKMYSEAVQTIFGWGKGKSGLTALISVPEILIVAITYVIGIICVAINNLEPFQVFLHTLVLDDDDIELTQSIFQKYYVHYCDAVGGNSTKVNDHIRELLDTYTWIYELVPKVEGKIQDYQLQVNFILSMLMMEHGIRFWPDFGRFYASRLMSLIEKIKYDPETEAKYATFFNIKQDQLRQMMRNNLEQLETGKLFGGYFWESITPTNLYTAKEIQEIEKKEHTAN